MQILAATDFSTRSQRALRRAGLLARERGAELALVHVVDDDQPPDLVALETREAERILIEQISAVAELRDVRCHPQIIAGDPFDGILRTAAALPADLIVMGAHRKQFLRDIFVGTTVERVIRTGPCPVLMANGEAETPYRTALAAVDMSEPSAHAIRTGTSLGLLNGAKLTLIHAFLPLAKGKMSFAVSKDRLEEYVLSERRRAADEMSAFLATNAMPEHQRSMIIEEGTPVQVISSVVQRLHPDLLVIGTRGRSGIANALLGSVTEEVLRSLDLDILAVPPAR
jgi:universal stress protein E